MAFVEYNGIALPYPDITSFSQDAVYDDSHTDRILTQTTLGVQFLVNTNYTSLLAPDLAPGGVPATSSPVDIMNRIRDRLLAPRRQLIIQFNSKNLVPPSQDGLLGTVDADNGPQPNSCSYLQVTSNLFLMSFSITARHWQNPNPNGVNTNNKPGSPVLNNRWTETVSIDDCNYATRTRAGKFIIRSDNAQGWVASQAMSQMCVVAVPSGFLRQSSSYTVDPSGLAISYNVTDKEVYLMPPAPAHKASGEFTVFTTNNGHQRFCRCRVALEGMKTTPKAQLIRTAVIIAATKCFMAKAMGDDEKGYTNLTNFHIKTDLYDNSVEVYLETMAKAFTLAEGGGRVAGVAGLEYKTIATAPFYSEPGAPTPSYYLRGSSSIPLVAAAYYDPNLAGAKMNGVQLNTGLVPGQAGVKPEA